MMPKFSSGPNTSPGAAHREDAPASQPYWGPAIYMPPPTELEPWARAVIQGPISRPPTNQSSELFTRLAAHRPMSSIRAI